MLALFRLMERWGMGQLLTEPDSQTLLLDQMLWQEAMRRGINMFEFRPFGSVRNSFVATLPDGRVINFEGVPIPPTKNSWWVNNKSELKKKLQAGGIPVARGGSVFSLNKARVLFAELNSSVVVKPTIGSASRHTTMQVGTLDQLERAFVSAKKISPFVMIEEELSGAVYRPTLVDGKLIATLRRDQAQVVGDGVHTIKELTDEANTHPARNGPYFSPINLDLTKDELVRQNLTKESIPAEGQRVQLNQKINWSLGGTTEDVTDEVHLDNKALFERIAQIVGVPLLGIDFIIEDISQSWKDQPRCGVIECNDMPYFDNHHLPFKGKPRDIAGPVWDFVLNNL
jgi:cyanophycin synthetase